MPRSGEGGRNAPILRSLRAEALQSAFAGGWLPQEDNGVSDAKKMKRWRIILIVFALVAVGVLVICLIKPSEPSYQGRKLSEWLADCVPMTYSNRLPIWMPTRQAAEFAVKEIGTNAIPYLLHLLASEDSTLKTNVNKVLAKQTLIRFRFQTYQQKAELAMFGFSMLREAAASAIPGLVQIASSQESMHRFNALICLRNVTFGNEGKIENKAVILPLLLSSLNDTNPLVHSIGITWLLDRFPEEAEKAGLYEEMYGTRRVIRSKQTAATTNAPATNK